MKWKLGPKIGAGRTNKSIRVDPTQLKAFREELKSNKEWAEYARSLRRRAAPNRAHLRRVSTSRPWTSVRGFGKRWTPHVNQLVDSAVRLNDRGDQWSKRISGGSGCRLNPRRVDHSGEA